MERVTTVVESLPEIELKDFEQNSSSKILNHFKNSQPAKISGLKAQLLKVSRETHISPSYLDENFDFKLEYSGGGRHFLLVTVRNYADGNVDYALASRPEASSSGWLLVKYVYRYGFLLLTFVVPMFMFGTAYVCFRLRPRWRLFWLIFICLGFVGFNMNWSTAEFSVFPMRIIFLGFKIHENLNPGIGQGQWILSVAIPLGALAYWIWGFPRKSARA